MADDFGGLVAGSAFIDGAQIVGSVALDTLTDSLATSYELWLLVSIMCVLGFGLLSVVMYPRIDGTKRRLALRGVNRTHGRRAER
jgi:hypothetical protein